MNGGRFDSKEFLSFVHFAAILHFPTYMEGIIWYLEVTEKHWICIATQQQTSWSEEAHHITQRGWQQRQPFNSCIIHNTHRRRPKQFNTRDTFISNPDNVHIKGWNLFHFCFFSYKTWLLEVPNTLVWHEQNQLVPKMFGLTDNRFVLLNKKSLPNHSEM